MSNAKKGTFRKFCRSLKPWTAPLLFSIFCAIASSVLGIFVPKLLGDVTTIASDGFFANGIIDWDTITSILITTIILFTASSLLNYVQGFILAKVTADYTKQIREQIIAKIAKLPIAYFDKHKFGDTLSRITNDVDVLVSSMSQEIADITISLTTLIGVTVMMFTISIPLSLIAIVTIPVSVFVVGKIAKYAQKFFHDRQNILGQLNSHIEEDYTGQHIIKSNSHIPASTAEFAAVNDKLTKTSLKAQFFSSLSFPVTHIFTNLGYVAVCIVGGNAVIAGALTIGSIQAFVQYMNRFNRPITEIAEMVSVIQSLLASAERIFDFLEEPEEAADPTPALAVTDVKGAVEFHNIAFSYDKKTPIITDFSAKVEPGQKVAIVGPTGAGKTTMINLLMRFYDPDSGYITIDGVPTKEMRRADVRQLFGMVLQDTWLFSGSILENLRYGNNSATDADIKRVAKICDIDHIIEALPDGYKTVINEDSDNVSAGEKQLLTIARAMIANPPMIILDEATSNVDTRTEQVIQDALEELTRGRTSFVIAHRLSTIRNSDLILVMKDGNIVEQGNHDTLLAQSGFYAELYNSQFAED